MNHIKVTGIDKSNNNDISTSDALLKSAAMDGSALIAIIRMPDLRLLFANKTFERHLGYSNKDIEENCICFYDFLDSNHHDRLLYQLNNVIENAEAHSRFLIYMLTGKNGMTTPYYLYASPLPLNYQTDTQLYHLTLHPDLSRWDLPFTSFVTRELFLEQFKSEYFGTFEQLINEDKIFWSNGIYNIYELDKTPGEISGQFMDSFIHPTDKEKVNAAIKATFETGENLNIEYKIITAKQNLKIIHCLGKIIKNKSGKNIKFAASIRDITEQRQIEEDLKNKVEELYHSNRDLTEFAYVASHDMQEPLRKITTFSDRLLEKYKDV